MRIAKKKSGLASTLNLALTSTALLAKYKFLGLNILGECIQMLPYPKGICSL